LGPVQEAVTWGKPVGRGSDQGDQPFSGGGVGGGAKLFGETLNVNKAPSQSAGVPGGGGENSRLKIKGTMGGGGVRVVEN